MKIEIDKEILDKTTKCDFNFSCLSNSKHQHCKIKEIVPGSYIITECQNGECSYFLSFGKGGFCLCPVRQEIYKKYKI